VCVNDIRHRSKKEKRMNSRLLKDKKIQITAHVARPGIERGKPHNQAHPVGQGFWLLVK
jgi:hypothetical protein